VDAAEVVNGNVDRGSRLEVFQLLLEAQREPCEPLHKSANGQIVPLKVAGAYRRDVVYPANVYPLGSHQRAVGPAAARMTA
jgi:hypothetical protein